MRTIIIVIVATYLGIKIAEYLRRKLMDRIFGTSKDSTSETGLLGEIFPEASSRNKKRNYKKYCKELADSLLDAAYADLDKRVESGDYREICETPFEEALWTRTYKLAETYVRIKHGNLMGLGFYYPEEPQGPLELVVEGKEECDAVIAEMEKMAWYRGLTVEGTSIEADATRVRISRKF